MRLPSQDRNNHVPVSRISLLGAGMVPERTARIVWTHGTLRRLQRWALAVLASDYLVGTANVKFWLIVSLAPTVTEAV